MMLQEEGLFELDDPLAKFIPEFGELRCCSQMQATAADVHPAKNLISIRHLLSHSAGLSYGFVEPDSVIDQCYLNGGVSGLGEKEIDLEELCAGIAKLPLAFEPGTSWRYSFKTDVCARLVEGSQASLLMPFCDSAFLTHWAWWIRTSGFHKRKHIV